MSFASDLGRFRAKLPPMAMDVFLETASLAHQSIQSGSAITAAPGQPVDTGNLKTSWVLDFPRPSTATITTNVEYAPAIEDGIGKYGPLTLRSAVGGWHSLKLTIAGFPRIVAAALRRVTGQ